MVRVCACAFFLSMRNPICVISSMGIPIYCQHSASAHVAAAADAATTSAHCCCCRSRSESRGNDLGNFRKDGGDVGERERDFG